MKRRISLSAAAVAGVSLALVVGIAPAVGKTARHHGTGGTSYKITCNINMTTLPPQGSTSVVAPASSGYQYGHIRCGQPPFYGGAIGDTFTVPDSGDTVGTYTDYLNTGTIRGSFDLTPQEGTFGGNSFQSQTWTGTVSVSGGTGYYKQISNHWPGTMNCSSPDSVHISCTETIRVHVVPPSN